MNAILEPYPEGYHSSLQKRQVARILWFLCQEDYQVELERRKYTALSKDTDQHCMSSAQEVSLAELNQLLAHAPCELFQGEDWNELTLKAVDYLIDILRYNKQPSHQNICQRLLSVHRVLKNMHF